MSEQAARPKTGKKRKLLVLALLLLLILLLIPPLLPMLLSTAPFRPVLERLLSQRWGVPVAVGEARLRWFTPSTLRQLTLASPAGYGDESLLVIDEAIVKTALFTLLKDRAQLNASVAGATLTVIRAPGGMTNLGAALGENGRRLLGQSLGAPLHVVVTDSTLRVSDRASGQTSYLTEVDAEWFIASDGSRLIQMNGQSEGPAGTGAVSLRFERTGSGAERTHQVDFTGRTLHLDGFSPLIEGLSERGGLGGTANLDLSIVAGPGPRLDVSGNGRLTDLEIAAAPWLTGKPMTEAAMDIAGNFSVDLEQRRAAFHSFRFTSSVMGIEGDGSMGPTGETVSGDLNLVASIHFGRLVLRFPPVARLLPPSGMGGEIQVEISPAANGATHLLATSDGLALNLSDNRSMALGESNLEADVFVSSSSLGLEVKEFFASSLFFELSGGGSLLLPEDDGPPLYTFDARLNTETRYLEDFLLALRLVPPMLVAGIIDVGVKAVATSDTVSVEASFASDDYDILLRRSSGSYEDTYFFRGKPVNAKVDASWPRGSPDLAADMEAVLEIRAPNWIMRRNEMTDLELIAKLKNGVIQIEQCRSRGFGTGEFSAAGQLRVGGVEKPELELRVQGTDLGLVAFPALLSGAATGVFAAYDGYWNARSTMKVSGELNLRAVGSGNSEFLENLQGDGRLEFSAGEVTGSALLDYLLYGSGPHEVQRLVADLSFHDGLMHSERVELVLPNQQIELTGSSHWSGRIDLAVSPSSLFDPDFVARYGTDWPDDIFRLQGTTSAPLLRLPDRDHWRDLAKKDQFEDDVWRKFLAGDQN